MRYLIFPLLLALLSPLAKATLEWPQEVRAEEGTIVIYQPQPETLVDNTLTARAAFALELKDREEPLFGAMWLSAKIDTDHDDGLVLVRDIRVREVRWPESKDAGEQRFTHVVESAMPAAGLQISLERLSASLATADIERQSLDDLKHEPPRILFRDELAVLLLYDGEPRFAAIDNSPYERALNTPFLVVRKPGGNHYLGSGSHWYLAADPLGPWHAIPQPPADLLQMLDGEQEDGDVGEPPAVVVATEPAELIASDGKPAWTSLQGGELLYVANTETPWLRELASGNMYVLLSGRWYRSRSQDGPWTYVRADELPSGFDAIPPASDIGGLRVSVAGTPEAEEAMLDAAVPQTAAIDRAQASFTVEYDGEPRFEKIPGTRVFHAVNTGDQVLEIAGRYYAVDQGVWFIAERPTGPWKVADDVPEEEIAKIPPSSPVYNTTHVHIYESTPEVVYVGYTPGYLWSFPYYGVPVYGTGWYYPPYRGRYYYPRPPTWGLHVGYNPWSGWNFGVSWSSGFFHAGISFGGGWHGNYRPGRCCGGWYGGGYRRPVVINTGDINIGNTVNIGNRTEIRRRLGDNTLKLGDSKTAVGNRLGGRNIYQRPENRKRNADAKQLQQAIKKARPAGDRANNLYADRAGNIARHDGKAWETRDKGRWTREEAAAKVPPESLDRARDKVAAATPAQREQAARQAREAANRMQAQQRDRVAQQSAKTRPAATRQRPGINRADLDRARVARQRGAARERARPMPRRGLRR